MKKAFTVVTMLAVSLGLIGFSAPASAQGAHIPAVAQTGQSDINGIKTKTKKLKKGGEKSAKKKSHKKAEKRAKKSAKKQHKKSAKKQHKKSHKKNR